VLQLINIMLCCAVEGVPKPPRPPCMKDGVRLLLGVGQTSQFAVTIARTLSTVTDASVFWHLFAYVL